MWERFNQFVFHLIGDFRNFCMLLLMNQPAQKLFLLHQVTFVNVWNSALEKNHCWQVLDTPLVSLVVVVNFHKRNVVLIAFVVNIFELSKDLLGFLRVFVI